MDSSAEVTGGKRRRFKPFVIKKGIVLRAKQALRKAHELSKSRNDSTVFKDPVMMKLKTNNRSLSKALADQRIECNTLFEEKLRLQKEIMRIHEVNFALRKEVQTNEADYSQIQEVFHGALQLLMTLTDHLNAGVKCVNDGRRRSRSVSLGTAGGRISKSTGQHRPGSDGPGVGPLHGGAPTSRKLHKVLPTVAGNVISHPSIVLPRLPAGSGWLGAAPTGPRRVAASEDTEEDETEEQDETEEEEEEVSDVGPAPGGRLQVPTNAGDLSIILEQSVVEERNLSPLRQAHVVVPAQERLSGDQAWLQLSGRRSRRSGRRRRSSGSTDWRRQAYPGIPPGSPAPRAAGGSRLVSLSPEAGPSTSAAAGAGVGPWTAAGSPARQRLSAEESGAGLSPIISGNVSLCRPSVMEASPGSTQYSLQPMELESESDAADVSAVSRRRQRRSRARATERPAESAAAPPATATAEASATNTTADMDDSVVITRKVRPRLPVDGPAITDAAAAAAAPLPEELDSSVVFSKKMKRSRLPVAVQARRPAAVAAPAPASASQSLADPAAASSSVEAAIPTTSVEEDTTTTAVVAPGDEPDPQEPSTAAAPAEPASASAEGSPEVDLDLSAVSVVVAPRKPRRGRLPMAAAAAKTAPEPEAGPDRSVVVPVRRTNRTEVSSSASADAGDAAAEDPADSAQPAAASAGEVDTSPADAFCTPSPQIGLKEPRRAQQSSRAKRGTAVNRAIAPAGGEDPLEGPSSRVWLAPRGGGDSSSRASRPAPADDDAKLTGQPVVVMDRSLVDSPEFRVAAARRAVNGDRRMSVELGRLATKRRKGAVASSVEDVNCATSATPDEGGGDGAAAREPARKRGRKKKSVAGKARDRRKRTAEEGACSAGASESAAAVTEERPRGDESEVAASDAPAAPPGENGVKSVASDAECGTGDGGHSRPPDRELTDPSPPKGAAVDSDGLNSGVADNAGSGTASVPSTDRCPRANPSPPEANCPDAEPPDPPTSQQQAAGRSTPPPEVDLISRTPSPEVGAGGGQCAQNGTSDGDPPAAQSQPAGLTVVGATEAAAWPEGLLRINSDPALPPGPAPTDVRPNSAYADGADSDSSRPSSTEPDPEVGRPRRRKPVSYREPSLNKKLRR